MAIEIANTQPVDLDGGDSLQSPNQPIDLGDSAAETNYLLAPKVIRDRAFKASYGLQNTPAAKTFEDFNNAFTFGRETQERAEAAEKLNQKVTANRFNLYAKTAAQKQGSLTPDDMTNIDIASGYNFPYKYPTEPKDVFEQNYATQYTAELDRFASPDSFWTTARETPEITSNVEAQRVYGSLIMAQRNYYMTKAQNVMSQYNEQTGVGQWLDYGKMAFPVFNPYADVKLRGRTPGVGFFSGLGGAQLEEQRIAQGNMDWKDFTRTVDAAVDPIAKDNPQAALAYLSAMLGQDDMDYFLNNFNTIANLMDVPNVFMIGKSIFTKGLLKYQTTKAIADVVKANANPEATKENILASVGNIPGSAVESLKPSFKSNLLGSSSLTDTGIDDLQRFIRPELDNIQNDSSLNVTHKNILQQQLLTQQDRVLNALAGMVRPEIVPLEKASEDIMHQISKETMGRYSMWDDIIRIADPLPDSANVPNPSVKASKPFQEPITRRWLVSAWLGKNGGQFFDSLEEALGRAQNFKLKVSYTKPQLDDLDLRIQALKQEYSDGPGMHADTPGMNYWNDIPNRIQALEEQRAAVSGKGGATIGQQGLGFYIEVTKPIDHTSKIISDFIVSLDRPTSVSPNSWTRFIPFYSKLRTAEDTMSAEHRANRKAAVYPQSHLMALAHETGRYIEDVFRGKIKYDPTTGEPNPWYKQGIPVVRKFLNKERSERLRAVLKYSQDEKGPDGIDGWYFENNRQLDDHYLRNYGEVPSMEERLAYNAVKNWWAMDHTFREVSLIRDKLRVGAETHQVFMNTTRGDKLASDAFDGTVQKAFPKSGSGNVLYINDDGEAKALDLHHMAISTKEKWDEEMQKQGLRVIKLYNPEYKPFKDLPKAGDNQYDYVMTKNLETKPLTWEQLPRRGGGHMVYDYPYWIKQADVYSEYVGGQLKHRYNGDTTLWPVEFRDLGQKAIDRLNVVKNFIRDGNEEAAKAAYRDSLGSLPVSYDEFSSFFKGRIGEDGKFIPPRFNTKEDFMLLPRNKTVMDSLGSKMEDKYTNGTDKIKRGLFINGLKEASPARQFQIEFTGQRDARGLFALKNTGTPENPIWDLKPAEKVDAIKIMNRSLGKIIRNTIMDDYKTYAITAFLQELKANNAIGFKDSEIKSYPYYIFRTMNDNYFEPTVGPEDRAKFMANHYKINQLVGVPNTWDTHMHSIAQKLSDLSYEKTGRNLVPQWLLHTTQDPFAFFRSLTFNAYLGIFAVPQMFVQSMTYVNIHGITPHYAPMGTMAALLHGYSTLNKSPTIVAALDKMATEMKIPGMARWMPGEFTEAMKALERTGFANVAGEYGPLDTLNYSKVVKGFGSDFLEWGRKPFQFGERAVRIGAWYTAFKEFRDQNPVGKLTNQDMITILDRADFLYGNMSSASNSLLHTGALSLPTQFYAYNLRLAELFFSKRIAGGLGETPQARAIARARILGVNGLMFGMPFAAGVTGLPAGDYLRQAAMEHGYSPGLSNSLVTFLMEGMMSQALTLATGNYYNVPQRYATGGFTQMRNVLNGDAGFFEAAGGATANFLMNSYQNTDGMWQYLAQFVRRDARQIPLKIEDFVDVFKEFTAVNKAYGLLVALNTGNWLNKSGALVSKDVSPLNAIFMTATGLNPLEQSDSFNYRVNLEAQQNMEKVAMKNATINLTRGYLAASRGDEEQAQQYFTKAMARLEAANLNENQVAHVITNSIKGNETVMENIAWERLIKHAPKGKEDMYREIYSNVHNNMKGSTY